MNPCASFDCANSVSESMKSGFCFTCLAALARGMAELTNDLDKVLGLEAQFVTYCEEHGLPNPHE